MGCIISEQTNIMQNFGFLLRQNSIFNQNIYFFHKLDAWTDAFIVTDRFQNSSKTKACQYHMIIHCRIDRFNINASYLIWQKPPIPQFQH